MTIAKSSNEYGADAAALLLSRLDVIVGDGGCLRDETQMASYAIDERHLFQGRPLAVIRPRDTAQVSAVVRECAAAGVAVVPQGGNTGLCGGSEQGRLREAVETVLADAMESGDVHDAVIAQNNAQVQALWKLRETIPEAQKRASASIKHDISVPVSKVPELLARGSALMREEVPDVIVVAFGHIGDGNIHFNANQHPDVAPEGFLRAREAIHRRMYELVSELDGSFSAEHGIGQLKILQMQQYRPAVELELMRKIKLALDPAGLLNPGKVL